jgi:hypothetical protein
MVKRTFGFVTTVCVAAGLLYAQRGIGKTGPDALIPGTR